MGAALLKEGFRGLRERGFANALVWVLADNPSRFFYVKMGAREIGQGVIRIGEQDLAETAYAWDTI
jgi:hypothetical protein